MKSDSKDLAAVVEALDGLRRELSRLGERVASLEALWTSAAPEVSAKENRATAKATETSPLPAKPNVANELNEELILIISAAIAAFLGKKPHIRQIRLIGSAAWAEQGRVLIQASHALSVHSPRS
jgi:methylmalonyl-CoA carboxyltransferase large subunit